MKHKTGGDIATGGFLNEPGTYHFCITDVQENPQNSKGQLIDNAAFRVACEVMAGTAPGQENKTCDILFFHPKLQDKNEGAFARKKIDRFLMAVGLATEEQITSKAELDIDLAKAIGRQFIAKMELEDGEGSKKFLRVSFADIFHVDDPAVQQTPKSEQALKLIHTSLRKIGNRPAPAKGGSNGATAKRETQPAKEAAAAKASEPPAPQTVADDWGL